MADHQGFTVTDVLPTNDVQDTDFNARIVQREQIVDAVLAVEAKFSRDTSGKVYATLPIETRIERHYVNSDLFARITRGIYGRAYPARGRKGFQSELDVAMINAAPGGPGAAGD